MNLNWFYKKRRKTVMILLWLFLLLTLSLFTCFRYFFVVARSKELMNRLNQTAVIDGVITEEPDDFGFKKSLVVLVRKIKINGKEIEFNKGDWLQNFLNIRNYFDPKLRKTKIRVITNCVDCQFGHGVSITGTLTLPETTEDFDSNLFLLAKGIQFEMLDGKVSKISSLENRYKLENYLYDFKNSFVNKINLTLPDKEEASLASGILITGKGSLSKKTLNDFKRSGLIHIVVLSGFNVSIVAQTIISILSFLPKIIGSTFGSIGIIFFCMMVGGGSTIIRALIMSLILIYANVFNLKYSALKSVVIAGVLMVVINPLIIIGDPSFQLSFACTLGLILLGNPAKFFFNFVPEKFGLREIVSSSFAVQIFALPLLLKFSGSISVFGIPANIVVVPFIPFAMLNVFLMGTLSFISVDLSLLFRLVSHLILMYILWVVRYISSIDSAMLSLGKTSNFFILCWYIVLILLSTVFYRRFLNEGDEKKNKKHPSKRMDET